MLQNPDTRRTPDRVFSSVRVISLVALGLLPFGFSGPHMRARQYDDGVQTTPLYMPYVYQHLYDHHIPPPTLRPTNPSATPPEVPTIRPSRPTVTVSHGPTTPPTPPPPPPPPPLFHAIESESTHFNKTKKEHLSDGELVPQVYFSLLQSPNMIPRHLGSESTIGVIIRNKGSIGDCQGNYIIAKSEYTFKRGIPVWEWKSHKSVINLPDTKLEEWVQADSLEDLPIIVDAPPDPSFKLADIEYINIENTLNPQETCFAEVSNINVPLHPTEAPPEPGPEPPPEPNK